MSERMEHLIYVLLGRNIIPGKSVATIDHVFLDGRAFVFNVVTAHGFEIGRGHPKFGAGFSNSAKFTEYREEFVFEFKVLDQMLTDDGAECLVTEGPRGVHQVDGYISGAHVYIQPARNPSGAAGEVQLICVRGDHLAGSPASSQKSPPIEPNQQPCSVGKQVTRELLYHRQNVAGIAETYKLRLI